MFPITVFPYFSFPFLSPHSDMKFSYISFQCVQNSVARFQGEKKNEEVARTCCMSWT